MKFKVSFDFATQTTVTLASSEGEIIEHKLYHIVVKEGLRTDDRPSIADSVYLSYKGKLLNGNVFDKKTNPVWFDTANVIRGFRYGLQYFSLVILSKEKMEQLISINLGEDLYLCHLD